MFCKEKIHNDQRFCKYDQWIFSWMKFQTQNMGMKEISELEIQFSGI